MKSIPITKEHKGLFNAQVFHPLQSYEWGEFREKTGVKVIRRAFEKNNRLADPFALTIHRIPHLPFTIGYLPKCNTPTKALIEELKDIGRKEKCIFIQLEPNVKKISNFKFQISNLGLWPSVHPLFTKYTFQLDLTRSEEELLKNMHPKTRYNIRVAQKHGVTVKEDNSDEAFKEYLALTEETTSRQRFYAHSVDFHKKQWQVLPHDTKENSLSSHLLLAKYKEKVLVAWVVFVFKDALYYPYGSSSNEHREVMASNLMMWEAIRFGKKLGLSAFDMWGALGKNPDSNDPWYGFHKFKQGYGPELVEFVGSFDLVINPLLYQGYKTADKLRWMLLNMKK